MGERRLRAAREAGLDAIPGDRPQYGRYGDMLRDALVENLHRSQLNPLEEAAAYQQLLDDFGITHEQLADRLVALAPPDHQHPAPAEAPAARPEARRGRGPERRARAGAARASSRPRRWRPSPSAS